MLDRIWLILIFLLAGVLPYAHASRLPGFIPGESCSAICCAGGCACVGCQCAVGNPGELPRESDPAVPAPSERELKRVACEATGKSPFTQPTLIPIRPEAAFTARVLWVGIARIESVFCVWRI